MTKISVTVARDISPRIESWLMKREIDYEVEVVRTGKNARLKIISFFPKDEASKHHAEMYKRFLERIEG